MATKATLKERIAALKDKRAGIVKEARVRVAGSWTLAKTLLPNAPTEVQYKLASALIGLDTKILNACVKNAAVNSYATKLSNDFSDKLGVELNKFIDDENLVSKLKKEVDKELSGEPKNASAETPAAEVVAAVEPALEAPVIAAEEKKADYEHPDDKQAELDAEEKLELHDKIETAENAIEGLESEIMEGEELDLSDILNPDGIEDKRTALANEGDPSDNELDDFADFDEREMHEPSDATDLDERMDDDGMEHGFDVAAHFEVESGAEEDGMGMFLTASFDDVVAPGEVADHFESELAGDDRDMESDHDDFISEVLGGLKPDEYEAGERDGEPKFEKAANKKKSVRPIRSLGDVPAVKLASKEQEMLAKLVFPDDV